MKPQHDVTQYNTSWHDTMTCDTTWWYMTGDRWQVTHTDALSALLFYHCMQLTAKILVKILLLSCNILSRSTAVFCRCWREGTRDLEKGQREDCRKKKKKKRKKERRKWDVCKNVCNVYVCMYVCMLVCVSICMYAHLPLAIIASIWDCASSWIPISLLKKRNETKRKMSKVFCCYVVLHVTPLSFVISSSTPFFLSFSLPLSSLSFFTSLVDPLSSSLCLFCSSHLLCFVCHNSPASSCHTSHHCHIAHSVYNTSNCSFFNLCK